jgi:excisionase family DNA binding protein
MSLEHSPQRQKKKNKKKRKPTLFRMAGRVCVSVAEWCSTTGVSRPTAYRMMLDGRLHYVQMGERMRKIPTTEYQRLGLVSSEAAELA